MPSIWAFPLYLLIMIFLGGGQEELGWRGYILEPMEEHLKPWLANLLLGVIWAVGICRYGSSLFPVLRI